jgi:hypothetical protein
MYLGQQYLTTADEPNRKTIRMPSHSVTHADCVLRS